MKKFGLLWVLVSALMLSTYTSCDELEGLVDENGETASGEEAFFPKTYADKELAAWYKWTETDKDKTKTEAVYLFKDNTFVVTKNKVHTDGRYERDIEAQGTYELTEGDYKNGKARVIVMADNGEAAGVMNVVIEDGHLTTDQGDEVFIIQDNAKRPKASDPASGNNNNGNNNQGQGGDGDNSGAFFPKAYAGKSISAWYSYSGSESGDGIEIKYVAAIYFFSDETFVATSNVAVSGPTGQSYERTVGAEGSWRIVEGNFNTGKVAITYDKDNTVILEIKDGQLTAIDTEDGSVTIYVKQDNSKVPEPNDPTNNGNQGGQGGDQGDSDVPAFFPTTYADKTVAAWYSCTLSEGVQTQVEAVFLFTDKTIIVTEHKVFASELQVPAERYIWLEGTYELSGDFDNGRADITLVPERKTFFVINDGGLKLEDNYFEYTRRELKDLPEPLEPTFNGGQGGDDNGDDDGDESDVKLVAWYTQILNMNGSDYEMAIILLDDNTIVFTRAHLDDETDFLITEIMAIGKYTLIDGDYTSGRIMVYLYGEETDFTIVNGVITGDDVEGTFIKQDNDKYTGPTDFSEMGGDDGGDDGDDDGDDNGGPGGFQADFQPYLPARYADKTIDAWYVSYYASQTGDTLKIESVFLFTDHSLVVTKSLYDPLGGRDPEYNIISNGVFELTEGDYITGKASVTLSDGSTFTVEIREGEMYAMDQVFYMQNKETPPTPIKI